MAVFRTEKVISALPLTLVPNTIYFVRVGDGFDLYVSDSTGSVAHKVNDEIGAGSLPGLTGHAKKALVVDADELGVSWFELINSDLAGKAGRVLEVLEDETGWGWRRPGRIDTKLVTDADYTLITDDIGTYVRVSSSTARNVNVPLNSTDPIPVGSVFNIRQGGAGQLTKSSTSQSCRYRSSHALPQQLPRQ